MKSELSELYTKQWFNITVVCLAAIGGLTQSFVAIIVPMLYIIGASIVTIPKSK